MNSTSTTPRPLIIVGAGGFGREVLGWVQAAHAANGGGTVKGFLDANPDALTDCGTELSVLGDPDSYEPTPDHEFICAIGDPETKLRVVQTLEARGARFRTLQHPSVIIGPSCEIGRGSVLCPGVVLTTHVTLEAFVTLNVHTSVGHDAVIGAGSTLSAHCDVTGGARLEEGVFLGSHASVLPSVRVGTGAVVGAGSVAVRDVSAHTTVMGVPAIAVLRPRAGIPSNQV